MTVSELQTPTRARPSQGRHHEAPSNVAPRRSGPVGWLLGRRGDPRWVRPALVLLLAGTAALYLWALDENGTGNEYYAAAVQAGTQSWTALLFGSLDSSNFITVDKPPAALWVMALSGRLFGFSSWSMLVPQALMGVASVALLYAAVRRWSGPGAGLAAGAVLALTPVAVLMFRFNNPDALLVLCLVAAAYATVRAIDAAAGRAGTSWLVGAGALVGLGFLTKMLQAFLVLPVLGVVFLLAAGVSWRRRLGQLAAATAALVVSAGWYVALVELWPDSARPYIGGSEDGSLLNLVLGYNGLGRLFGGDGNGGNRADGSGSPSGLPGGLGGGLADAFGGETGLTRMFNSSFGGQVSWLLPAALITLVAGLWITRRAPRTDRTRAALVLWGGWMLATGLVFSFMSGTVHAYYAVALAPGIAGTLAVGGGAVWRHREHWAARLTLAATLAVTAGWSVVLLRRTPEFLPWLRWVVAIAGVAAVLGIVLRAWRWRRAVPVLVLADLLAGSGGTVSYTAQTVSSAHHGSVVTAGPSNGGMTGPGGVGGPDVVSSDLSALIGSAGTRWSAATTSAQTASGLELSTGTAVMALGGFSGSDDATTLEEFQARVAAGDVHYFVDSGRGGAGGARLPGGAAPTGAGAGGSFAGGGGPGGQDSSASRIADWVRGNFPAIEVGGTTVYDLTAATG